MSIPARGDQSKVRSDSGRALYKMLKENQQLDVEDSAVKTSRI